MAEKKKILVVDDVRDARLLFRMCLSRLGYEVFEAGDGIESLEQAAAIHPDLILMDISMPRLDGKQATARLKANPATRDIPVIVVTAHTQPAHTNSALEAGALEVVIKPVNFRAVGEIISRYLLREDKMKLPPTTAEDKKQNSDLPFLT